MRNCFRIVLTLVVSTVSFAAETSADEVAINRVLQGFAGALNKGESTAAVALFAPEASITDDLAPHYWSGPNAAQQWTAAFQQLVTSGAVFEPNIKIEPVKRLIVSGNRAFAPAPALFTYRAEGKQQRAAGIAVFCLEKMGEEWKIRSFAWAPTS